MKTCWVKLMLDCLYGIILLLSVWTVISAYRDSQRRGESALLRTALIVIFWPVAPILWWLLRGFNYQLRRGGKKK